jgi:hypothetical protein
MPTTRTPIRRPSRATRITPETVQLFARAVAIEDMPGATERWENEGGRRREYLDLSGALAQQLGLKPWHPSPLDVADERVPADLGEHQVNDWVTIQRLRKALWEALEAAGKEGPA